MVKHLPDYYGDLKSCVTADSVYLLRKIELIGFFCVSVTLLTLISLNLNISLAFFSLLNVFHSSCKGLYLSLSSTNSLGFLEIPELKFFGGKSKTVPCEVFRTELPQLADTSTLIFISQAYAPSFPVPPVLSLKEKKRKKRVKISPCLLKEAVMWWSHRDLGDLVVCDMLTETW